MTNLENYQYPYSYVLTSAKSWSKYGISKEQFLSLAGIEDRSNAANATFNGEELQRLCALARRLNRTGTPESILVAEHFSFTNVGLFGLAVPAAENFKQVLTMLCQYSGLFAPGFSIESEIEGDNLYVDYWFDSEFGEVLPFLNEVVICIMRRFADLFSDRLFAQAVYLAHESGYPIEIYENLMECPVTFLGKGAKKNRIHLKTSDLKKELLHPDSTTLAMIQQQLQQSLEKQQPLDTWEKKAKALWLENIDKGQLLSQTDMAKHLHMSVRTFVRKLADEGTAYRESVNKWRLEKAKELLTKTSLPITDIGEKIGFKDESAFFRFFKQATDITPLKYRQGN